MAVVVPILRDARRTGVSIGMTETTLAEPARLALRGTVNLIPHPSLGWS